MQTNRTRSSPSAAKVLLIVGASLVGSLVLIIVSAMAVLAWLNRYQETDVGRCKEFMGMECTSVRPEVIGELSKMTLPAGTVVESSEFNRFQDWMLRATFVVPAAGVAEWEGSLTDYPPASAAGCKGLESRGELRTCSGPGEAHTNPVRSYTRVTQADGSVVVMVYAFSM